MIILFLENYFFNTLRSGEQFGLQKFFCVIWSCTKDPDTPGNNIWLHSKPFTPSHNLTMLPRASKFSRNTFSELQSHIITLDYYLNYM